jgi:hypothetical protein
MLRVFWASWQNTALLGTRLLVGLWFWVPPLMRAVVGGTPEPELAPQVQQELPEETAAGREPSPDDTTVVYSWETVDKLLESDPLVQSAELAARHSDPFGIDPDQFSPPVLFAEEPAPSETQQSAAIGGRPAAELVLKSTIVGEHRRGALINRRLYLEGSKVKVGGKSYLLTAVYPRKVVLQCGDETLELKITRPGPWNDEQTPAPESTANNTLN